MTTDQKPPLGNLAPPVWGRLSKPRPCVECYIKIKKGERALVFPFTKSVYCRRCGGKLMEEPE